MGDRGRGQGRGTQDRPPGGWGRPRPCGHSCPLASFSGLRPAPYCWPLSLGPPTGSCPSLHPFLAQQFSWKHGIWSRRHTPHSRLGSFLPATRDPGPVPVSGESWPGMVPQASGPSLTGVDSHSWGPGSPRGAAVLMRRKGLALSQGCAARKLQADVMKLKSELTLNGNHPLVTLTGSCSLGPPASQPQNIFFNMKH